MPVIAGLQKVDPCPATPRQTPLPRPVSPPPRIPPPVSQHGVIVRRSGVERGSAQRAQRARRTQRAAPDRQRGATRGRPQLPRRHRAAGASPPRILQTNFPRNLQFTICNFSDASLSPSPFPAPCVTPLSLGPCGPDADCRVPSDGVPPSPPPPVPLSGPPRGRAHRRCGTFFDVLGPFEYLFVLGTILAFFSFVSFLRVSALYRICTRRSACSAWWPWLVGADRAYRVLTHACKPEFVPDSFILPPRRHQSDL